MSQRAPATGADAVLFQNHIDACKSRLVTILDQISTCNEIISRSRVRATIKVIAIHEDGDLYVNTLARDTASMQRCRELDNRRAQTSLDPLEKNPDFKALFSQETYKWHFLSNDLTKEASFSTTSISAYQGEKARSVYQGRMVARLLGKNWPLPYKSTLTCAIRQQPLDGNSGQPEAVGFLCIDSHAKHVFIPDSDVQLCFSFADALFHPIDHLLRIMASSPEQK